MKIVMVNKIVIVESKKKNKKGNLKNIKKFLKNLNNNYIKPIIIYVNVIN